MRLETLDARWKEGVLTFDCPCGKCAGKLRVPTTHAAPETHPIGMRWQASGEFPNLTILPSVDAGCWHGFITNGEVSTV